MKDSTEELVIPIIREELHADTVAVKTGGVRVTKSIESRNEVIEQELRKSQVEVKRVKTERVVEGPQPARRVGNTLIVPVVSEVLQVQKKWVVTEEIHITEVEERETVQHEVTLNQERARIERVDKGGNVIEPVQEVEQSPSHAIPPSSVLQREGTSTARSRRTLTSSRSLLKNRKSPEE